MFVLGFTLGWIFELSFIKFYDRYYKKKLEEKNRGVLSNTLPKSQK